MSGNKSVLFLIALLVLLPACSSKPYQSVDLGESGFLQRTITQREGEIRVTVAVPTAQETQALTGLDLYDQGIQPVWFRVENLGDTRLRIAHWSIDRDYFSPIEVAYMNRKKFSSQGYDDMQRWFYEHRLHRRVPPGETRSGLVYTHFMPGTKGFNLDIFTVDGTNNFTFFVPIAGYTADYAQVDFDQLYTGKEERELKSGELRSILTEQLPCCATDATGEQAGDPINIVLAGTNMAVRRSLLRAGWHETATEDATTIDARMQYYRNRPPDTVFIQDRDDSEHRLELRLWLAPWRRGEVRVWVGQAVFSDRGTGLFMRDSEFFARFAKENIAADIDSAAIYVLQQFWYTQSLSKMGRVAGVEKSTPQRPRRSFTGAEYFSDGGRLVMLLSETPVAMDETEFLYDQEDWRSEDEGD